MNPQIILFGALILLGTIALQSSKNSASFAAPARASTAKRQTMDTAAALSCRP